MIIKSLRLFDSFDNLDQIEVNSLISWIKNPPLPIQLENYLANKILYPKALPITILDMQIDLAILREALRGKPDHPFLNTVLKKIIIPEAFLLNIPNIVSLTWAFVDGLLFNKKKENWYGDLWSIVVAGNKEEVVGSVLIPQFTSSKDILDLKMEGHDFKIKAGTLIVLPSLKNKCEIDYKLSNGKILGKQSSMMEIYGGRMGLMIDGRII